MPQKQEDCRVEAGGGSSPPDASLPWWRGPDPHLRQPLPGKEGLHRRGIIAVVPPLRLAYISSYSTSNKLSPNSA
eukprot:6991086-Ditylum_brightwellii.AAC.1